nr:MAG TPA: hypothetical protein [Caudoviricetes sp.]
MIYDVFYFFLRERLRLFAYSSLLFDVFYP